ncbi:hypothetical protein ACFB49_20130 [Sphingomonas sp. DBB INV C78]|uniref:TIR domain-containing protein n=1 Tax=Sphingomonas sp. DBB INV C78 TaxID=3349434 RepID=UPI0036D20DCE
MSNSFGISSLKIPVKPRVFVSYHHRLDQGLYNSLAVQMQMSYELVQDNSLDRQIDSDNAEYVMRKIREEYLTGTSCTVVLCGADTPDRKFVDWEIMATLQKEHALVGLRLPTLQIQQNGGTHKPARLQDNIDSGYAVWGQYSDVLYNPGKLAELVHEARSRSKRLIDNTRQRRIRNG